jgi:hypothetical protein
MGTGYQYREAFSGNNRLGIRHHHKVSLSLLATNLFNKG